MLGKLETYVLGVQCGTFIQFQGNRNYGCGEVSELRSSFSAGARHRRQFLEVSWAPRNVVGHTGVG